MTHTILIVEARLTLSVPSYFSTLVYRGGRGPVGPPLEMAFLQQKCANFGPEVKFDKILAIF